MRFGELFLSGGFVMWALLAVSFAIWFLMAWWWWHLWKEGKNLEEVTENLIPAYRAGGIEAVRRLLGEKGGRTAEELAVRLERIAGTGEGGRFLPPPFEIERVLESFKERLAGPDAYLRVLVRIAPLLGLLGTVYGMVQTFEVLTLSGAGDPRALSGGISCALLTTQAGLLIALPGLYGNEWLKKWSDRVAVELDLLKGALLLLAE